MEFKILRNIENSFKQIRLFTFIFSLLCFGVVGIVVYKSYSFAEEQRQKIYVLDNGKSLMVALSQDMSINRPVEAREHVRRFHELFFTIAPDIRMRLKVMLRELSIWPTNQHLTTIKIYRKKGITTGSSAEIFSRELRSTVLWEISITILTG
ncbi:Bacteroides conjugative transposon TraK protein [Chryseobacterium ureilyticum]|uniref:Bacteroides conjugative transposon TraK protein n=1 Tax=Chryseobacterium ureilyticum TaxID=373668 RepID=A0A1N7LE57_9FLAO|nr:Bacteroides conjugative transposon TraK protein [Chryseobacterium ureilyticum]